MNIYEFAEMLNGREYRNEITPSEEQRAKELGFVVVFGYSDDNAEFRGAYADEVGCFNGGRIFERNGKYIDAVRHKDGYSFTYNTNIPHATFDIYENGEKYCKGIVFDINDCSKLNRPLSSYLEELERTLGYSDAIWLDELHARKARAIINEIRNKFS